MITSLSLSRFGKEIKCDRPFFLAGSRASCEGSYSRFGSGIRQQRSTLAFGFNLPDTRLDDFLDHRDWQRPVDREMDGALRRGIAFQFAPKGADDRSFGEQAAMVGESGVPDNDFLVPKSGNAIADRFGGRGRQSRENRRAKLAQCAAGGLRNGGNILLDGLQRTPASSGAAASNRSSLFHAAILYGL